MALQSHYENIQDLKTALEGMSAPFQHRVQSAMVNDQLVWIKRPEALSWRMWLQKGNAASAFKAEVAAHQRLAAAHLPVADVILAGDEYLVLADCGQTLLHFALTDDEGGFPQLLGRAAQSLSEWHTKGISHGRPSLKDICWDGRSIRFLDLERCAPHRDNLNGHAEDLIIFVFNTFAVMRGRRVDLTGPVGGYLSSAPPGILPQVKKRLKRLRLLSPLTWPIRQTKRAFEFKAIPKTLAFFDEMNDCDF